MQSTATLILLISGLAAVVSKQEGFCPNAGHRINLLSNSREDDDDTVELFDKDDNLCLTARLSMDVIFDEDIFVEDERRKWRSFHVKTKYYKGICEGEVALLAGENVTGPAVLFAWNETLSNQVLIRWEVADGKTFLNEIKIKLTIPEPHQKYRYLSARLSDLQLFPSDVGKEVNVSSQDLGIYFRDSSKGCLVFRDGGYYINSSFFQLSVVTVVVLALILGIMMALGVMCYQKGSRKKLTTAVTLQP